MTSSVTKMLRLTGNRHTLVEFPSVHSIEKQREEDQSQERDRMSVYRFTFLLVVWECDVPVYFRSSGEVTKYEDIS